MISGSFGRRGEAILKKEDMDINGDGEDEGDGDDEDDDEDEDFRKVKKFLLTR